MPKRLKKCNVCEMLVDERVVYEYREYGVIMLSDVCLACIFKLKGHPSRSERAIPFEPVERASPFEPLSNPLLKKPPTAQ